MRELRKQIGLHLTVSEKRLVEFEAARRRISMTKLILSWVQPEVDKLKEKGLQNYGRVD